jgi:hypothetical protein
MIAQYLAAGILDLIGTVVLIAAVAAWVQRRRERRQQRAYRAWRRSLPTIPTYPTRRSTAALPAAPIVHEGATEAYADELAATCDDLPSIDLRTTGQQMAVDHAELDVIGEALDQMGEAVVHSLRIFLRDQPDVFLAIMARWSGGHEITPTGEFSRRELEELLAADGLTGAVA